MINQGQHQKQQLKISANKIQLLNFFALNTVDLEQHINAELAENPFLELQEESSSEEKEELQAQDAVQDFQDWEEYGYDDLSGHTAEYQNYFGDDNMPERPLAYKNDFKEDARQQLSLLFINESQRMIAEYIIDVLNDRGQLDKDLEDIAEEISFREQRLIETSEIEEALAIVQELEPIGIGARNIKECLLLQMKHRGTECRDVRLACELIEFHYTELVNRQFERITQALRIDSEHLKKLIAIISKLKFYPVSGSDSIYEPKNIIVPDLIIAYQGDTVQVSLRRSRSQSLSVNPGSYDLNVTGKTAGQYIRSKMHAAEWLIEAIREREEKMLRIMKCIVAFQYEYFKEGDIRKLKPMVLRNISDITGYDISTISRITTDKYADTHFGFVYLKDLFSEGIADSEGQIISNKVIQSIIEEMVAQEDKRSPYTDQQLLGILYERGYKIARRTVTKYRELLNIPIAQIRAVTI